MTVVYIDQVFLLNTIVDYLLLLAGARLAGTPLRRLRFLLCAGLGGLYAAAVFFDGFGPVLAHPIGKILSGVAISWIAYAKEPRSWRIVCLFFLLSGGFAGILLALGLASGSPGVYLSNVYYGRINWAILLISAAGISLLLHLVFRQGARHGGNGLMDVEISIAGKKTVLSVLHDTGNTLRNPVNGKPVLVVEQDSLRNLWPAEAESILRQPSPPEEKMAQLYQAEIPLSFTLLPFRSVGVSSGLLLAVHSDYIRINGKKHRKELIALVPGLISDGGGYHGLWGGEEREGLHEKMAAETASVDSSAQQAG